VEKEESFQDRSTFFVATATLAQGLGFTAPNGLDYLTGAGFFLMSWAVEGLCCLVADL